jgi:uncharacterized protein YjeT (DUF2065 family)
MRIKLAWILGLLSAVNGLLMMVAPAAWYPIFPGVVASGPFNAHFIRDIGAAFLVAGLGLVWFANDARARPAALAAAGCFGLHALIHIGDALAGRENFYLAAFDAPTVYLSAVIALWIAWPQSLSKEEYPMIKWLLRRRMAAFEREYDYDLSYAREILDVSTSAAFKLGRVMSFGNYRKDVPRDASCAAGLAGTMAEDCGPCTQLVATMAERDGVAPATIKAILAGDERAMTPDALLGFRFAQAVLRHDPVAVSLREEVVARWGRRALVSLAFGITTARVFPTLKYALGYGRTCTQVRVAGTTTAVTRRQAA